MPGFREFTRIFFGPSSFESAIVTASTAALVALYTEPSVSSPGLGEETFDVVGPRDVRLNGDRRASFFADAPDDGVGPRLAGGVVDNYGGSLRRQMLGDRGADALGSPCHDCDFSF